MKKCHKVTWTWTFGFLNFFPECRRRAAVLTRFSIFKTSLRKLPRPNVISVKDIICCVFFPSSPSECLFIHEGDWTLTEMLMLRHLRGHWAFLWPAHPFLSFRKPYSRLSFAPGIMGKNLGKKTLPLLWAQHSAASLSKLEGYCQSLLLISDWHGFLNENGPNVAIKYCCWWSRSAIFFCIFVTAMSARPDCSLCTNTIACNTQVSVNYVNYVIFLQKHL